MNPNDALSFFYKQAIEFGFKKVFLPWDFIGHIEQEMGWRFWLKPKEFLLEHRKHLEHVLPILSDSRSRECLWDVFKFRSGQHLDYSHFNHSENHYFNELTLRAKTRVSGYLDVGAYHGETLMELESLVPVEMAMMFEPDDSNFSRLLSSKQSSKPNEFSVCRLAFQIETRLFHLIVLGLRAPVLAFMVMVRSCACVSTTLYH